MMSQVILLGKIAVWELGFICFVCLFLGVSDFLYVWRRK